MGTYRIEHEQPGPVVLAPDERADVGRSAQAVCGGGDVTVHNSCFGVTARDQGFEIDVASNHRPVQVLRLPEPASGRRELKDVGAGERVAFRWDNARVTVWGETEKYHVHVLTTVPQESGAEPAPHIDTVTVYEMDLTRRDHRLFVVLSRDRLNSSEAGAIPFAVAIKILEATGREEDAGWTEGTARGAMFRLIGDIEWVRGEPLLMDEELSSRLRKLDACVDWTYHLGLVTPLMYDEVATPLHLTG